ncbi:hypothetical protein SDC9_167426 [bioreactor metagenome]|uniref:Uncharacterized protein n=1 Tax=bioreactor metagenome TaxID=1076179 RepID=A0A645G2C4_9ZZZZ
MFLVPPLLHLAERLGITGNRGDVESPVFLLDAALALFFKESHSTLFVDGLKEFTAPLGWQVVPIGVDMQTLPVGEAAEGIVFL